MADEPVDTSSVHNMEGDTTGGVTSAGASMPADGGRPEWYPEGVDTPEQLAEWNARSGKPAVEAPKAEETAKEEPAKEEPKKEPAKEEPKKEPSEEKPARTDDEIRASLKEAGGIYADPDYEPFALAFEKNGSLTPEEMQAAADKFSNGNVAFVKSFIEAQTAAREGAAAKATQQAAAIDAVNTQVRGELHAVAGGPEQYAEFQKWTEQGNLTAAQAEAYNKADPETAKVLLANYVQQWKQAGGGNPARDLTEEAQREPGGSVGGPQPYGSNQEMYADMGKPEYKTDPAFRAKVAARVAVTK